MSRDNVFQSAIRHFEHGRFDSAETICHALLESEPGNADALHMLGVLAQQQGDLPAAVGHVQAALEADPGFIEARNTLGNLYVKAGMLAEAEAAYREVISARPELAAPWNGLGNALRHAGRREEAIAAYREATGREPGHAGAWANLGVAFLDSGDDGQAVTALQRAVSLNDGQLDARNALAVALQRLGRMDEAIANLQAVIRIEPKAPSAHNNLGNSLLAQGRLQDAAAAFQRALELQPEYALAHHNLGNVWEQAGQLEKAAASYARALALQTDFSEARLALLLTQQRLCQWDAVDELAPGVVETALRVPTPPFVTMSLGMSPEQQLAIATTYAKSFRAGEAMSPVTNDAGDRPITVGYLSADFRDHPVGRLIAPVLENHDRERVRVIAFSYGPDDQSSMRQRLVGAVDEFVDLRYHSHEAAAQEIRSRGVQILVDLTGYTRESRPEIMAMRPAPVQVSYLGYSATLGADFADYIIVDDYLVPAGAEKHYSEQPVRLPQGFVIGETPEIKPVSRQDCLLAEEAFVFCCFNNTYKIGREVFACWMQLLSEVPDSVLWLKERNPYPRKRLRAAAREQGVYPDRLVFAPPTDPGSYFGQYAHADLFLDTWPYNAGSTAIHALLGGCPVLTRSGDSYVSRMAGSILHSVGLEELICTDMEGYFRLAKQLATTPQRLTETRARLQENLKDSPFLDAKRFAVTLETAFGQMLQAHAHGDPPAPIRPAMER